MRCWSGGSCGGIISYLPIGVLIGDHILTFFVANFLLLIVWGGSNLQICRSAEALMQITIDLSRHCRRQMTVSVSAASDYDHRQPRIGERRIRSEQTYPTSSSTVTGAGLSRHC